VVNLAIWKMRPPLKAGDPSRRVKTYGSGFVVDPTGIIVTKKHTYTQTDNRRGDQPPWPTCREGSCTARRRRAAG
jgi:hypothetical protein